MMKTVLNDVVSLMRRLRECVPLFIASTIVTALAQIAVVGVAVVSVWITTTFVIDQEITLYAPIVALFAIVATFAVSTLFEVWWSHEVAYRILHTLRVHIYAAIKRIAPLGLNGKRTADVASAAMNDAEQLEWFYAHTASTAICAVISPAILVTSLCTIVGPLGLVMVVPLVAMVLLPLALMPIQRRQGFQLRDALVDLRVAVLDSIQGQRELRSLGMVESQNSLIDRITRSVQKIKNRQTLRKTWESAFAAITTSIATTIMLIVLTAQVLAGTLNSALLPVAVVLAGMSTLPAITLVGMLGRIGEIGACATRINTIINTQDPIPMELDPTYAAEQDESHTLIAANITFSYGVQPVMTDVDVEVSPIRSVAIIGSSGAGKTTFANLAMRFLDPDTGHMRFDGLDLKGYQPDEYRSQLALVPQDCHIFAGTIRRNLQLAKEDATDDEMWAALRAACLDHLVTSLGGLDTPVGDRGTTISGGERQRIGIARAFLRNPTLLILDEPLANIDPFLEASIAANTRELRNGRATIVIAHRLASILIADHIVILDGGRIIAQGTHQELLSTSFYNKLLGDQISTTANSAIAEFVDPADDDAPTGRA